jgi:asparagine synthase (glutamine-hydrolysing)
MANEDETIWITFNGEIYNFTSLRKDLKEKGHIFKSDTDTEVIIHLYEEEGISCMNRLRGMFAFAIWDEKKQQLLIARDRIGKKPLFYTMQENRVVFASELKAIAALPWIKKEIDLEALAYVFSYDHIPWPRSIYKDIRKLPPGSFMTFGPNGQRGPERYWRLDLSNKTAATEKEALDFLSTLLKESIQLRMRSDVPLGMFLSGGLDSSFIVGLASKMVDRPIRTFSIGYRDEGVDDPEFSYSKEVSDYFHTVHQEILFDESLITEMPHLMYSYDEPFCIPNALAHYQLCREARKQVTVALAGDGSDEIFAGYDVYKKFKLLDLASILIPGRQREEFSDWPMLPVRHNLVPWSLLNAPRAFRRGLAKQITYQDAVRPVFTGDAWHILKDLNMGRLLSDFYLEGRPRHFLDGLLYMDLFINYAWSTTIATDISGMSNSLEVRSPFLDHKVVEFAFSLPARMKLRMFTKEKYILYKAGASFLPESVTKRKKMSYGAGIPYKRFFFNQWAPFVKDVILDQKIARMGIFDRSYVERLLGNPEGPYEDFKTLWRIFCTASFLIHPTPDIQADRRPLISEKERGRDGDTKDLSKHTGRGETRI